MWRAEILDQRLTLPEFILNRWVCSLESYQGVNERLKQASGQAKLFNSREASLHLNSVI